MAIQGQRVRSSLLALACFALACGGQSTRPQGEPGTEPGSSGSATTQGGAASIDSTGGRTGGVAATAGGAKPASGGAATGAGAGGAGGTDEPPPDPYAPRSGPFKMLVYSRTQGFDRAPAIKVGKVMLNQIADEQGFEVVATNTNELITRAGLGQFELVFFLNTSGDVFNEEEEQAFEEWMTTREGAFAGVLGAADTEFSWSFYSEVIGQNYDGHGNQNTPDEIVLEPGALSHPAVIGLPNPWPRFEQWQKFNSHKIWTAKPGFRVLGRKAADQQPVIWTREWGNFRSFFTGLGHDQTVFQDPMVKKHLTGAIMWLVRREQLIK